MNPHGISEQNKRQRLYKALEIDGGEVPLHPNTEEVLKLYILRLDADRLGPLIMLINAAKQRYAKRVNTQ